MGRRASGVPAVSVVIPCHDYGRYLRDAVNSVLGGPTCLGNMPGQTMRDLEVVLVDDASTDDTAAQLRLLTVWPRVRALILEENVGTAAALNAGISEARGEHVYVLSADDMAEPWALEALLRRCRERPHSVAYGDVRRFSGGRRRDRWPLTGYDFEKVIKKFK